MHRQEGCTVKLLKCRNKNNVDVFDCKEIKMAQVKLCGASINEKFISDLFEVCLAILEVRFWLRMMLGWFFSASTFVEHMHVNVCGCAREVLG
jgi:hypothetical protein